ncbi:MAG: NAD(P)/FAD-dependent oxidoreductase [Theionarchaea archaeon]|nr:NAD(P)/FAD-dependent oxidoreductase [Theionarchaea archaeon]MBU7001606.1 NAD(P)/FAD-dependent oxidoreductase [Theionarchaea archaeon]MBU7021074.1 NAD(P)/FAD-dependent oxidoreductase [Theionarchaea archaeon]MBU7040509.1 NAD(P)/FAD-dependent oxidoreductase [Theionarchaea archaeon]
MSVIVIGSGIGGLCAASLLSLSGEKPLVLEKETYVGGRATSFPVKGCLLDYGWHASYYSSGHVGGTVGEILQQLRQPVNLKKLDPPLSQYRQGVIESVVGFRHVPPELRPVLMKFAADIRKIPYEETYTYDDMTVLEWAREKTDDPVLLKHFNLSSYFAITAKADKASAGEYFRVLQIATSMCQGLGYPAAGGIRTIADSLVRGIESLKGQVITGAEVVEMDVDGERVSKVLYEKDGELQEIVPDTVIFNPPVYSILDYITEFPSEFSKRVKAMKGNHTGPSTQVYVCLTRPFVNIPSLVLLPEDADMWQPGEHCALFSPSTCSSEVAPPGNQLVLIAVPYTGRSAESHAVDLLKEAFPGAGPCIKWVHSFETPVVDGLAKHVGWVGRHKVPVSSPLENLYFVGDTVEGTGPGMELPADSAQRCVYQIQRGSS